MKTKFLVLGLAFCSALFFGQMKKNAQVSKLYQNYIAIKNGLASDDTSKAAASASEFLKTLSGINSEVLPEGNLTLMRNNAKVISESDHIKVQRTKFKNISNQMIAVAKQFKVAEKPVYVQYCPMVQAGWLSSESKIINPYYGSSMLNCGTVQQEIK
ncbi:DUF3347 domain-containing protein [Chryseobacterium sp. Leaf394]|uniref:DUF3347 domain-containing protein n=1 Tax=Chryseobacterium sp. Leaf394 TaxID=1736361 RepID=UPI0006FD2050|nr:DUF3347 domain-containing protein [Chryseobacterium sp. Leaf394]KQS92374.1 hypothetical protein ASG21_07995 [Chryseobacterium sp. Leaf394]